MDTTLERFKADVIDASMQTPVVVDFWAPWCGPCKTLGPMLEKLEQQYGGRFLLVKVDTDAQPELAQHFRIRSIPTVFGIVNGQPVDQFQGALPESQLREFIDRLLPNPGDIELEQAAQAVERGDMAAAVEHLQKAIATDPANDHARLMYAQLLLQDNDAGAAQAQLARVSVEAQNDPQVQALLERVRRELAEGLEPPPVELVTRVADKPDDLRSRLDLAQHYIGQKTWAPALEQLLEIVRRDRGFGDDVGRKTMIEVFGLASAQPELVSEWRRRLSAVLF
ncbi:MAG: thioredoxin [Burkholderiales bacterium]|nr:MAG: thioredoxin [Burkholderiales bacterium]